MESIKPTVVSVVKDARAIEAIKTVSLSEAKAQLRADEKSEVGATFRWVIKSNSPLESVFNSAKLFNAVFDVVLMSPTKAREFQIASTGKSTKINAEDFSAGYLALYQLAKDARQAVVYIDSEKKKISMIDDSIRVIA